MNSITTTRKQRIAEAQRKRMKARNQKLAVTTMTGAFMAMVLMSGKVEARSTDYIVKPQDTLYGISKKYQVSVEELIEANSLTSEDIVVGQKLLVPTEQFPKEEFHMHTVQTGDTLFDLAKKYGVSIDELKTKNNLKSDRIYIGQQILVSVEKITYNEQAMYTVVPGDSLWGIAKRFGISVEELATENGLNREIVLIGQRLSIPGSIDFSEVEVVGVADNFTVEFQDQGKVFVLKVPYGQASKYVKKSGKSMKVFHKNGAIISGI